MSYLLLLISYCSFFCSITVAMELPLPCTISKIKLEETIDTTAPAFSACVSRLTPIVAQQSKPYDSFANVCYHYMPELTKKDTYKAVALLHACAANNHGSSAYVLSLMYRMGNGLGANAKASKVLENQAVFLRYSEALGDQAFKVLGSGDKEQARRLYTQILTECEPEENLARNVWEYEPIADLNRTIAALDLDSMAGSKEIVAEHRQRLYAKRPVLVNVSTQNFGKAYFWFNELKGGVEKLKDSTWFADYTYCVQLYKQEKYQESREFLKPLVKQKFVPAIFLMSILLQEHSASTADHKIGLQYLRIAFYEGYPPAVCYYMANCASQMTPQERLQQAIVLEQFGKRGYAIASLVKTILTLNTITDAELVKLLQLQVSKAYINHDVDILPYIFKGLTTAKKTKLVSAYKKLLKICAKRNNTSAIANILGCLELLHKAHCIEATSELISNCLYKRYGQKPNQSEYYMTAILEHDPHSIRLALKNAGIINDVRIALVKLAENAKNLSSFGLANNNYMYEVLLETLPKRLIVVIDNKLSSMEIEETVLDLEDYCFVFWCTSCSTPEIANRAQLLLESQPKILVTELTPTQEANILKDFLTYDDNSHEFHLWCALHGDYNKSLICARELTTKATIFDAFRAYPHFVFACEKNAAAKIDLGIFLCHFPFFANDPNDGAKYLIEEFEKDGRIEPLHSLACCNAKKINIFLRERYQQLAIQDPVQLLSAGCINMSLALYSESATTNDYKAAIHQLNQVIQSELFASANPGLYKDMFFNILEALEKYSGTIIKGAPGMKKILQAQAQKCWPDLALSSKPLETINLEGHIKKVLAVLNSKLKPEDGFYVYNLK